MAKTKEGLSVVEQDTLEGVLSGNQTFSDMFEEIKQENPIIGEYIEKIAQLSPTPQEKERIKHFGTGLYTSIKRETAKQTSQLKEGEQ